MDLDVTAAVAGAAGGAAAAVAGAATIGAKVDTEPKEILSMK